VRIANLVNRPVVVISLVFMMLLPVACASEATPTPGAASEGYLLFNQRLIEGLTADFVDIEDVDEVFSYVFSMLPEEVMVYPSENYYYWILYGNGTQLWGNIRLPAGARDNGVLSFGYFIYKESAFGSNERFTRAKFYSIADGLLVEERDPFSYVVEYKGKSVTFNLHQLSQKPPELFPLREGEIFIERTFDESGYQFFLIFNELENYFLWILNEEEVVTDNLDPLEEDFLLGRRSAFVFWVDAAHGDRKILAGVYGGNTMQNNYFDGPFDQLADNYAEEANVSYYMERAFPYYKGRIDKYGYILDTQGHDRVSLSTYHDYWDTSSLKLLMERIQSTDDPYPCISSGGWNLSLCPEPTAEAPTS